MLEAGSTARAREEKSFCRICTGQCGVILSIDDRDRIVAARGDRSDAQTLGYICAKGACAPEMHNHPERLLHPLKRMPDGRFVEISLAQALEEIGDKLAALIERDGPAAVGTFRGTASFFYAIILGIVNDWMAAIGSHKIYSTFTIDQSAKSVAVPRLGYWAAGKHRVQSSQVHLLVGANPIVSVTQLDQRHPVKRMKAHKARGMKLIVIDPRRSETAAYADIHMQPLPGQDGAILASILRTILEEGWHDAAFCAEHVADLDLLREAVAPFDPESVARRADIPVEQIFEVAAAFARDARTGVATSGTGPSMSPHSNVAIHLMECLNVVCGRFVRAGEEITNAGFIKPAGPQRAQVARAPRTWDAEPKNRINGWGPLLGEMATATLAEDILRPGPGQLRALFNFGGAPATCIPDQRKMVQALRSLELFVSIDPFMTPSTRLSHYVLPPRLLYEREDLPFYVFETYLYPRPWTRYAPKVVDPPAGSDLCKEWDVLWALARRLGKTLAFHGVPLDMEKQPSDDDLLAIIARNAALPWEQIKARPEGIELDTDIRALPADPATASKFTTMPQDVREEVKALLADAPVARGVHVSNGQTFSFLLSSRRQRNRFNSFGFNIPALSRAMPVNYAYMNPQDMAGLGIATGAWIEISSDAGQIRVLAHEDDTVRSGVISMCHGYGGLPDEEDYARDGVSPNQLISTDRDVETINAMPRMSAIPVNVRLSNGPAPIHGR